ncbi:DUF4139 domain-containing protein [bacterium]|nr:DUF4139 domain-containing protein [bacterium]
MKGLVMVLGGLTLILSIGLAWADEVALTVYNQDFALVREVRSIELSKGTETVRFKDVAARIDPTSVRFKSLTAPDQVLILEQNYEYDLVSSGKLLQKYLDRQIRLLAKEERFYEGTLLSAADDLIIQDSSGQIKIIKAKEVQVLEFPQLPEGLITRPTLVWLLDSQRSGKHETEVSYLTDGVNWHAEYVAAINEDDTRLELGGWVSLDNRSGATYRDAKLKLVAGEVHRVRAAPRFPEGRGLAMDVAGKGVPQFEEKAFFEYHMYTLNRPATVKDNQIKQLTLFPNADVRVKKILTYNGVQDGSKVRINLEFKNNKQNGLGIPLPQGKLRVYKKDEDQSLQFVGEDLIDHTPKDEKVRVFLGNAFDIVGERKQVEYRKITDRSREETYELKLRNHKEESVEVVVVEGLWGDWKITSFTHDHRKKDSRTVEFPLLVPGDGETVLKYSVRFRW